MPFPKLPSLPLETGNGTNPDGSKVRYLGISLRRLWITDGGIQDGGFIMSTVQALQDLPNMVHPQGLEHELHLGYA